MRIVQFGNATLFNCAMEDVLPYLDENSIDAIVMDPPYKYLAIDWDKNNADSFSEEWLAKNLKRIVKDDGFIVNFGRGTSFYTLNYHLANVGLNFKEEIIWAKNGSSNMVCMLKRIHETIALSTVCGKIQKRYIPYIEDIDFDFFKIQHDLNMIISAFTNNKKFVALKNYIDNGIIEYTKKKTVKHEATQHSGILMCDNTIQRAKTIIDGKIESSIIKIKKEHAIVHPTQKPIALMDRLIKIILSDEQLNKKTVVLDPFMGSGSTIISALGLGTSAIGIEKNAEYFDIACDRIRESQRQQTLF